MGLRETWHKLFGPRLTSRVLVDEAGVRRLLGDEVQEAVGWDELQRVEILTTDDGPWAEDAFWLLHGLAGGVAVPNGAVEECGLLAQLQARLTGFDNEQVILAMGTTTPARFLCWSRERDRAA